MFSCQYECISVFIQLIMKKIRLYIVKNLSPWMIDELLSFARTTSFIVILLRPSTVFYNKGLSELSRRGISVIYANKKLNLNMRYLAFCLNFFWHNRKNYLGCYNFIIGIQSIYYFLKMDKSIVENAGSIHAQFATQASIVACLIKEYLNDECDLFITCHAYDIFYRNNWLSYLINKTKYTFTISDFNKYYIINNYHVNGSKVILARLGVNRPDNNFASRYRGSEINIGFMSYFTKKKGIQYFLDAVLHLKYVYGISLKVHIAGDGEKKYKLMINEFINKNKLSNDVKVYGRISGEDKSRFYKAIDVFVLPSVIVKNDMEGIPVVLMEAISYGIPVISTDISGISEICRNKVNGSLIPQKDSQSISSSIFELYQNKSLWEYYSKNSKLISQGEYSLDVNSVYKIKMMNWI